jgi:hypothetical protein
MTGLESWIMVKQEEMDDLTSSSRFNNAHHIVTGCDQLVV